MITKKSIQDAYTLLRGIEPFKSWRLPAYIEAQVSESLDDYGAFEEPNIIIISKARIWEFDQFIMTVAHEMVHLHQSRQKKMGEPPYHNAFFFEAAKQVCKEFGWKESIF